MDVSLYISELLKQNGEIIVPGLGFLVHARVSAYYNEAEGKFYPPYHKVHFDAQIIDDDTLPQYIADKRNISLASAKYFTEKYIESLRHDALVKDVPVADLGWFYMDQSTMAFKTNDTLVEDADLFGFQPVEIRKQRPKMVSKNGKAPAYVPEEIPAITFTSKTTDDTPQHEERFPSVLQLEKVFEEDVKRRSLLIYILIGLVLFLGIAFIAVYQFSPATYQKMVTWERQVRGIRTEDTTMKITVNNVGDDKVKTDSVKADSTAKRDSTVKADSAALKPGSVKPATATTVATPKAAKTDLKLLDDEPVSVPHKIIVIKRPPRPVLKDTSSKKSVTKQDEEPTGSHFEVIVGTSSTLAGASAMMNRLANDGVSASLSIDMPGPTNYLTIGTYSTFAEAEAARQKLLKDKKISNTSYTQEIKQQ